MLTGAVRRCRGKDVLMGEKKRKREQRAVGSKTVVNLMGEKKE